MKFLSELGYYVRVIFGGGGGLDYRKAMEHKIPLLWPNQSRIQAVQKELLHEGKSEDFNSVRDEIIEDLFKVLKGVDVRGAQARVELAAFLYIGLRLFGYYVVAVIALGMTRIDDIILSTIGNALARASCLEQVWA